MPIDMEDSQLQQDVVDDIALLDKLTRRNYEPYNIRLDNSDELAIHVIRDFTEGMTANWRFKERHVQLLKYWRGINEPKTFPFRDASNVIVPLTSFFIETLKSRLLEALLGDESIVSFTTLDGALDDDTLQEINDWFRYELEENVDLYSALDSILQNVLIDGFSLPVPYYESEKKRLVARKEYELQDDVPLTTQMQNIIPLLFPKKDIRLVGSPQPGIYKLSVSQKGNEPASFTVTFTVENEQLVAYSDGEETIFDGVKIDNPNLEDVIILNVAEAVGDLPYFGLRLWLSVEDFKEDYAEGEYVKLDQETFDLVIASAKNRRAEFVTQDTTDTLDNQEGVDSLDEQAYHTSRRWLEIYCWEGKWKIKGEMVDVQVWVVPRTKTVIKINRLEKLNKDGKRSPVKFSFIPQNKRFYPVGLAEWLMNVQIEMDAIHNQRLDAGLISNVPFFFYTPALGNTKTILELEPGKGYPIKDTNGVIFPKINWSSVWSEREEARVRGYAQEQAGLGDPALGSFISKRASASEFLGTQNATDLRTKMIVKRLLKSLRELLYRVFGLYQQYIPNGRIFQVSGLEGERFVRSLSRDRIQGRYVLRLTGNIQQLSAQLQRDISVNMLSLLMNPLLIQMGIVKPDTVFAAIKRVFQAAEYRGVRIYEPDLGPESPPPDVEHRKIMIGEDIQPSPNENFGLHIAAHARLMTDPNIDQLLTPEQQQVLAQHVQQTHMMQMAMSTLKNIQAANAAQMQQSMQGMGINPSSAGGQQMGDNTTGATEAEGLNPPAGNA